MTRAELLGHALDEFLATSPEVEAAAIVSADGFPIASALPEGVEEERLAAMSAALLILGERAAGGLGKGDLAQVLVEAGAGYVVLMSAEGQAVLVAVTSTDAKAGLLLFEMKRMASKVASLMRAQFPETPERATAPEVSTQEGPPESAVASATEEPSATGPR